MIHLELKAKVVGDKKLEGELVLKKTSKLQGLLWLPGGSLMVCVIHLFVSPLPKQTNKQLFVLGELAVGLLGEQSQ